MAWRNVLKEKIQEHVILGFLALITFLALVLWRAVPSSAWDRISELVPKAALWSLLGLASIAAVLEAVYILQQKSKRIAFGVTWDRHLNPLCSVCGILLYLRRDDKGVDFLSCPKCHFRYGLRDESYNRLSLPEAKEELRNNKVIKTIPDNTK